MRATSDSIKDIQTLKKRADFLAMNGKAKKCVAHGVILQAMPNNLGVIRVGFTVTKKTEMSAVKRNRIKRRLRAAAKDIIKTGAKPAYDYVLIGKLPAAELTYNALCGDIKDCLKKLGCLAKG